ncbi:MAG: hypothetical protein OJF59_000979 [Cytophagales bacterium]|jgi:hypothetical protein|nr:hypothetical protein [Bacteroidota bacterium]MBS1980024.1 hypothetical protein [Bacteroidota bacterium]WHZ07226.1 MAG: hypothetical protein OJF59_000979 [Cytophagales bacterium]
MQTLSEIVSAHQLSQTEIDNLSYEAREFSIDCGKADAPKQLSPQIWNLFDSLSDTVWHSSMAYSQIIPLGFNLFELFPSYYHFLIPFYHGIKNKKISGSSEKEMIWKHFTGYLVSENYYADPVGYVLWADFFEDEATVREAWQGLVRNSTGQKSLLRLIEVAGPVPFDLKNLVYENLLADPATHDVIFNSLLSSAHDVFGQIDKEKARNILVRLTVNRNTVHYKLLEQKLT